MTNGIYFQFINLEERCRDRISSGHDFFIQNDFDISKLDSLDILTKDTIYSSKRFGPQKNDREEVQKYRFSCNCGLKTGNDALGEYCLNCHSEVTERKFGLDIVGWIKLPIKILTPIGVYLLKISMSGKSAGTARARNINEPITKKKKKKKDTETKRNVSTFDKLRNGLSPFLKDDLYYLYDRFEEVISPHIKNKSRLELMIREKDRLFTNVFPVISKRLRRFMITMNGDVPEIKADTMSTIYTNIISIVNLHKASVLTLDAKKFIARGFLDEVDALYTKLAVEANYDKEKAIKGEIYSTKNPYSARVLVEPDNETKLGRGDACRTSYDVFRTLHKESIMKILKERYNMNTLQADRITDSDFVLSEKEKTLLREILDSQEFWIFINRPPSIDMSAIIAVEILDLCDENICYINPIICGLVRGDFDGDTFSVYLIPMPLKWRLTVACNPRRHSVCWDRSINSAYGPINDHVVSTHMLLDNKEVEWI